MFKFSNKNTRTTLFTLFTLLFLKVRLILSAERSFDELFTAVDIDINSDSNRMLMDDLGISSVSKV